MSEAPCKLHGGTFKGIVGLSERNPQGNSLSDLSKISVTISGGEFISTNNTYAIDMEDIDISNFSNYKAIGSVKGKTN